MRKRLYVSPNLNEVIQSNRWLEDPFKNGSNFYRKLYDSSDLSNLYEYPWMHFQGLDRVGMFIRNKELLNKLDLIKLLYA